MADVHYAGHEKTDKVCYTYLMGWPEGISDGLSCLCVWCGIRPWFDYRVDDAVWRAVVPREWRAAVVCLPCLDRMACRKGVSLVGSIEQVQFTGTNYTVCMEPIFTHDYRPLSG